MRLEILSDLVDLVDLAVLTVGRISRMNSKVYMDKDTWFLDDLERVLFWKSFSNLFNFTFL